jgi:hypothetical protein
MKSTKLFNFAFCIFVLFFIGNQQLRAQSILPQLKDKSVSISIVDQNLAIAKRRMTKPQQVPLTILLLEVNM